MNFPGGTVGKNLPADAGDHGFDPWSRKIPVEQLTRAPQLLGPRAAGPEACAPWRPLGGVRCCGARALGCPPQP